MKNFTTQISIKRAFLLSAIFAWSTFSFGQENPWEINKKENPWGKQTEEIKKEEPIVKETADVNAIDTTIIAFELDSTVIQLDSLAFEFKTSETDSNKTVISRTKAAEVQPMSLYEIERKANEDYNAGVALAASIPAILFPPITFPLLIASVFVPTPQQNKMIEDFKRENPTATEKEVKAVNKGIRKKRAKRTAGGAGIGLGAALATLGIAIATLF